MELKDIKSGIEVNGLDETLKRLCNIINNQEKEIAELRNVIIANLVKSCMDRLRQSLDSKRQIGKYSQSLHKSGDTVIYGDNQYVAYEYFDANTTYSIGYKCLFNSKIYEFKPTKDQRKIYGETSINNIPSDGKGWVCLGNINE